MERSLLSEIAPSNQYGSLLTSVKKSSSVIIRVSYQASGSPKPAASGSRSERFIGLRLRGAFGGSGKANSVGDGMLIIAVGVDGGGSESLRSLDSARLAAVSARLASSAALAASRLSYVPRIPFARCRSTPRWLATAPPPPPAM